MKVQDRDKFFSKLTKGDMFYWSPSGAGKRDIRGTLKKALILVKYHGIVKVIKKGKYAEAVRVCVKSVNSLNEEHTIAFDLFSENQIRKLT